MGTVPGALSQHRGASLKPFKIPSSACIMQLFKQNQKLSGGLQTTCALPWLTRCLCPWALSLHAAEALRAGVGCTTARPFRFFQGPHNLTPNPCLRFFLSFFFF